MPKDANQIAEEYRRQQERESTLQGAPRRGRLQVFVDVDRYYEDPSFDLSDVLVQVTDKADLIVTYSDPDSGDEVVEIFRRYAHAVFTRERE